MVSRLSYFSKTGKKRKERTLYNENGEEMTEWESRELAQEWESFYAWENFREWLAMSDDDQDEALFPKTESRRVFCVATENGQEIVKRLTGRKINPIHEQEGYGWLVKHGKGADHRESLTTRRFRKRQRGGKARRLTKDGCDCGYHYNRRTSSGLLRTRSLVKKTKLAIATKEEAAEYRIPQKWVV